MRKSCHQSDIVQWAKRRGRRITSSALTTPSASVAAAWFARPFRSPKSWPIISAPSGTSSITITQNNAPNVASLYLHDYLKLNAIFWMTLLGGRPSCTVATHRMCGHDGLKESAANCGQPGFGVSSGASSCGRWCGCASTTSHLRACYEYKQTPSTTHMGSAWLPSSMKCRLAPLRSSQIGAPDLGSAQRSLIDHRQVVGAEPATPVADVIGQHQWVA